MKCGDCIYWENDVCYKRGVEARFYDNACGDVVKKNVLYRDGLEMNLKK